MFSAQNKPTIVNEGLYPVINDPKPVTNDNSGSQNSLKPQTQTSPSNPVKPPLLPESENTRRVKKVLLFLIPVALILGVMVLTTFLVSVYKKAPALSEKQTPVPTLIPATPVPTPEPDPFSDWKAYSNRTNEISLKYPASVKLKEEQTGGDLSLVLSKEADGSVEIAQLIVSKSKSPEKLVSTYVLAGTSSDVIADEDLQISGVTAKIGQFTSPTGGEGTPVTYAYLTHNKLNFLFIGRSTSEKELFMQILSTIRFISPGVTSDWLDYKNTTGSFSLKYPPTWIVKSQEATSATGSAKLISISKNEGDPEYQNILVQVSSVSGKESVQLSASELISSLQNLSGWNQTPTLDFRSFGSAQSQIISGMKDSVWTEYGVFWIRNTLVQLTWKDTALRQEQETFDDILSTLVFR